MNEVGREGERMAARYLESRGWEIREKNWSYQRGEVDLIIEKTVGRKVVMAFVEVKTKSWAGIAPQMSVGKKKRAQLIKLAGAYVQLHQIRDRVLRFDVVEVVLKPRPRLTHLPGAFDALGRGQ